MERQRRAALFRPLGQQSVSMDTGDGGCGISCPSNNANGLTHDLRGRLLLAQTGLRRVARRDSSGNIASLAALFGGKKLNSPNDIVVKSDGAIFLLIHPSMFQRVSRGN